MKINATSSPKQANRSGLRELLRCIIEAPASKTTDKDKLIWNDILINIDRVEKTIKSFK